MKNNDLHIEVKITETEVFQKLLEVYRDFAEDVEIPEHKRKEFIDRVLQAGVMAE